MKKLLNEYIAKPEGYRTNKGGQRQRLTDKGWQPTSKITETMSGLAFKLAKKITRTL
jgi:hypothetical protein